MGHRRYAGKWSFTTVHTETMHRISSEIASPRVVACLHGTIVYKDRSETYHRDLSCAAALGSVYGIAEHCAPAGGRRCACVRQAGYQCRVFWRDNCGVDLTGFLHVFLPTRDEGAWDVPAAVHTRLECACTTYNGERDMWKHSDLHCITAEDFVDVSRIWGDRVGMRFVMCDCDWRLRKRALAYFTKAGRHPNFIRTALLFL